MEIHPPEKPLHSIKDILLQLMTITLGILIALSLEGLLASYHHAQLVREAKENLREEILANTRELDKARQLMPRLQENLEKGIHLVRDFRDHRDRMTGLVRLDFTCYLPELSAAGWETAASTGAFAYMKYGDVKRYKSAYSWQQNEAVLQDRLTESLALAVPNGDISQWSNRELDQWRQQMERSLQHLRMVQQLSGHLGDEYAGLLKNP